MTYDQWKCHDPNEPYYDEPECEHEVFEIDMEGRAHCDSCSATWWAAPIEIDWQREQQAEYDTWCRQQERRELWRIRTYPVRMFLHRLLVRIWPRKSLSVLHDDEIPF